MQNSSIEWCDHTFNPWHGCIEVSPGCIQCYARVLNHRYGFDNWGPAKTTPRRMMSESYWKQPIKWNSAALARPYGTPPPRVFVASMADVFEVHEQVANARVRLWETIGECDALDWLLLTKRPQNVLSLVPPAWAAGYWPDHVWIGTSVEDQARADERIPELLKIPAKTRFLSCEPLIAPVQLPWCNWCGMWGPHDCYDADDDSPTISWVIIGGESGHGARPMEIEWAGDLVQQCRNADISPFVKQMGFVWAKDRFVAGKSVAQWGDVKGHDMQHWPLELRVREFPRAGVVQ